MQGRASYSDAEQLFRRGLEVDKTQFEAGHLSIARSQSNLAVVLKDLGDLEGAHTLIRNAYNSFLKKFGEEHRDTIITKGHLESILKSRRGEIGKKNNIT